MSPSSTASTLLESPASSQAPFGIPASRLPVHLILLWGEARAGELLLRGSGSAPGEVETVGERLNDPSTRFVPVSVHGAVELVRLDAVACLELAGELPEAARLAEKGAYRIAVAIELMTGEAIRGHLVAYAPPGRSRLSDILDRPERFFLVTTPGRTVYVHRDAVATVRALSGPSAVSETPR